jgi:hypothetical protein
MFVPFDSLHPDSRLWIFQAEQKFSKENLTIINSQLELFTSGWQAHGQPLQASFQITEDRFILLAVNESFHSASGCSIDGSVHAIKEVGRLVNQDLFRRDFVSFKLGDQIQTVKLSELKESFRTGKWNENTLTFNTLVGSKGQLTNEWLVPAKTTWLRRYIIKEEVTH